MIRSLTVAIVVLGIIIFSFFHFYHFLKKRIVTSDLKAVTEKRIGASLKASVHVDRISVGLLRHISLSGLEINRTQGGYPFLIGVKKIIVRYDLASFLKRNFRFPSEIFLDSPRLTVQAFQSAGALFEIGWLRSNRGILTRFEFEGGQIQLPWFRSGQELRLRDMKGKATPKKGDQFDVRFQSRLSGVASGSLSAYGEIDSGKKSYRFLLTLDDVAFSREARIPITQLRGSLELENGTIRIRKLKFLFRGVACELFGQGQNLFSEKPALALSVHIQEGKLAVRSDIHADFKGETILGVVRLPGREYRFSGSLTGAPTDFRIPHLTLNDRYHVSAQLNVERDLYELEVESKGQRLKLNCSVGNFAFRFIVKLDHFKIFGFDLVTYATVDLKPYEEGWQRGVHVFRVHTETEYLVFQYQPLRDFKASARLSADGLDEILAEWGNVSRLGGKISFGETPVGDLTLAVGPLSLNEFKSLGTHPLPLSFDGIFEGKLEIRGPLERPNLSGVFTIEKGTVGSLNYDRAIINFSGRLPYLLLKDSKIGKGKNVFLLKGGFDFALRNFLEGIHVDNSEHIIIWRGLELSSEHGEASLARGRGNSASFSAQAQA